MLVRKGGFEPPRLTAPPPQDGASASSATSARGEVEKFSIARLLRRFLLVQSVYFVGVGADGAGAGTVGANGAEAGAGAAGADFDVFENCCSTELPAATEVEF